MNLLRKICNISILQKIPFLFSDSLAVIPERSVPGKINVLQIVIRREDLHRWKKALFHIGYASIREQKAIAHFQLAVEASGDQLEMLIGSSTGFEQLAEYVALCEERRQAQPTEAGSFEEFVM